MKTLLTYIVLGFVVVKGAFVVIDSGSSSITKHHEQIEQSVAASN